MFFDYFFRVALVKKFLFWLDVFAISFLVMVQPARAEGIVVGASVWGLSTAVSGSDSTAAAACYRHTGSVAYVVLTSETTASCGWGIYVRLISLSCPTNSTGTTACTCNVGYVPSADATTCVVPAVSCPAADTLNSQGFFNIGTTPNGSMPSAPCVNGCALKTTGSVYVPGQNLYISASPKFKQIRNGVFYYFVEASFWNTGKNCSPDTPNFLADFVGSKPDMTCQAGQQMISMSGVTKCFNSDGTESNPNSASAVAAAKTLADAKTAKAIADAASAVAAAGGSASDVAAAKSIAAGVAAAGGTGGGSTNPDPVQAAFCAENPTATICVEQDFGAVEDSSLTEKSINVAITPGSVGGAGSCPAPSSMILHGRQYWFQWTTYCNFATGIKPILLAFAWLSAASLLIGGFKTA